MPLETLPPEPEKEIPHELNKIDRELDELMSAVEELTDHILTVTSAEASNDAPKESPQVHTCEVAGVLNGYSSRIKYAINRINSLTSRIQL